MNASGNASIGSVIATSFKNEGMSWMFKGWTPAWIRLSPNTIIILCVSFLRLTLPCTRRQDACDDADAFESACSHTAPCSLTLENLKKGVDYLRGTP